MLFTKYQGNDGFGGRGDFGIHWLLWRPGYFRKRQNEIYTVNLIWQLPIKFGTSILIGFKVINHCIFYGFEMKGIFGHV